jgi:hypothetical protein
MCFPTLLDNAGNEDNWKRPSVTTRAKSGMQTQRQLGYDSVVKALPLSAHKLRLDNAVYA